MTAPKAEVGQWSQIPLTPFVVIPRAICTAALWDLPFSTLLAMAEAGEQGLSVIRLPNRQTFLSRAGDAPLSYMRQVDDPIGGIRWEPTVLRDVAVFYGDHDKTFLHGQGW